MDLQEVFNTVVKHLRQQGEKAVSDGGDSCYYRQEKEDGRILKCAVGCLISDDNYHESLEHSTFDHPDVRDAVQHSLGIKVEGDLYNVLNVLQDIHDDSPIYLWEERFQSLARSFNLAVPAA